MDWLADFLGSADLTGPAVALFLGVLVGLGAGWAAKLKVDRRDEKTALAALIMDLHLKRTLAEIEPRPVTGAADEALCRSAILDARESILEALTHVRSGSPNAQVLLRLFLACGRYLRATALDPERYQFELMELRETLVEGVFLLSDGEHLQNLVPGERPAGPTADPARGRWRRGTKRGTNRGTKRMARG